MQLAFMIKSLEGIALPSKGRIHVYDAKTPGLCLCVASTGSKVFYLYRRVHGKPSRIRLGAFPEMTIDQARRACARQAAAIADGRNPNAERRSVRQEPTLGKLWEHYRAQRLQVRAKASTLTTDKSRWETCWAKWEGRRIGTVTRDDVAAEHVAIAKERGKVSANRAVQLLRRIWAFCKRPLGLKGENPATEIDLFTEASRERFLVGDELPRLFEALALESEDYRDFFMLLLWTGARRSNVQAMRWADIRLDVSTWTIGADDFKAGKAVVLPLAPPALDILRRRGLTAKTEWVFPSTGKTGHLVEPKGAWDRIRKRAKIEDVRIHDLRRTLGSWQAALGTPLNIIGRSLGHSRQETTAIYARLNLDTVRASVEAAVKGMQEAGKAKE